ncbi:MAG: hypothetical protein AB7W28_06205 [Armatimonadota bacterium]
MPVSHGALPVDDKPSGALVATWKALAGMHLDPAPLPLLAGAAGACPLFRFDPGMSAQGCLLATWQGDALVAVATAAGARAEWVPDVVSAQRRLSKGAALVIPPRGLGARWRVVLPTDATSLEGPHLASAAGDAEGPLLALTARGDVAQRLSAQAVLTGILAASAEEAPEGGGGVLSSGPGAVDVLRRALAEVAHTGLPFCPKAAGWLVDLTDFLSDQLLLAADAVRLAWEDSRGALANSLASAAAANFDCAVAYVLCARTTAKVGLGEADLDPAHWGVIYDSLRQGTYHWRTAAKWLTLGLDDLQNAGES